MNPDARALGRMARGVPKTYTAAELARRTKRLAKARKGRWAGLTAAQRREQTAKARGAKKRKE